MKDFIGEIEEVCVINGDCGDLPDPIENAVTHLGVDVTYNDEVVTSGEA